MNYLEEINSAFPNRKTKNQKTTFTDWAVKKANEMGYRAQVETTTKGKHKNVVIGNPETAKAVFTAHYDTPANMMIPNLVTPNNRLIFLLYTLFIIFFLFICSFLAGRVVFMITNIKELTFFVVYFVYLGLLFLMMIGPGNKHNLNDNTSGCASVFSIMDELPEDMRNDYAFILFDNEEKGLLGSSYYAKDHKEVKENGLIINLDCVGFGKHFMLTSTKKENPNKQKFDDAFNKTNPNDYTLIQKKGDMSTGTSDFKNFKCGINVMSFKKAPFVGLYATKIHTVRDTECSIENIHFIKEFMLEFIKSL